MTDWTDVCDLDEIDAEDVIRFDHGGRTFAVYRAPDDAVFCTAGLCTHEDAHLADGLVQDHAVDCPKHGGRFDYRTGAALRAPACVALATYPARVVDGRVQIAPGD